MNLVSGSLGQPGFHLGVFVRRVVVHDQMHVQLPGNVVVDMPWKGQKLLVPMAAFALTERFPRGHVQRREQCGRAMSNIIVHDPFGMAEPQRQRGLRALQRQLSD